MCFRGRVSVQINCIVYYYYYYYLYFKYFLTCFCSYRYTVLRALPGLKTLDKIPVQPEEVQDAVRRGRELVHPEVLGQDEYWEQSDSRDCSPPPAYQRVEV